MLLKVNTGSLVLCGFIATLCVPVVSVRVEDPGTAFAIGWCTAGIALLLCSERVKS